MPEETIGRTLGVAAGVCVVCSVVVSTAAVCLRGFQERNKTLDRRTNILIAAGVLEEGERADVDELFKQIDSRWIDVATGDFVEENDLPAESRDERKASRNPTQSIEIDNDLAGIKRRATYRQVYFTRKNGRIERIILPVHGKGLWSTMYGFLALDSDTTTIRSFAFYEHGETPGLGGEVDNNIWKRSWLDKKAFDESWQPRITIVKGKAGRDADHEVDGLSGATLTARGVQNLVRFWLGEEGYGPLLAKLRTGEDDG